MESRFDALLFVSFGGPEGMDDVLPFLENVLRGKNVPRERMMAVAKHYEQFGGVSPINGHTRALIEAVKKDFADNNLELPIYWGNRNWHPMLEDTVRQMKEDGIKNALAFVTSAYASYSSCRQYLEDIERARTAVGEGAPEIHKLRVFFNHPGFLEPNIEHVREALNRLPADERAGAEIIFSAHSIPESMAEGCHYESQLLEACKLVCDALDGQRWKLTFQSRSGPPTQKWLEPDICDYIAETAQRGTKSIVVLPIGFICDHMEVLYDIDTEAVAAAKDAGITMSRAKTVGTHPRFVSMVRDLVMERLAATAPLSIGTAGLYPDQCQPTCCQASKGH